jgi:hypothetical protein
MKKLPAILGFFWAVLCLIIVLVMFPGLDSCSRQLAKLPFMKINPTFSGGDTAATVCYENYVLDIHEPVFAALIGESSRGFVQLDWTWKDSIPVVISDTIDYNMDLAPDFIIGIDPSAEKLQIKSLNEIVKGIEASARTENGWIVRVELDRARKRAVSSGQ